MSRVMALILIGMLSSFFLAHAAYHERGYCKASGDFADSDNMTVLSQESPHWWKVQGKDGNVYDFNVCPSVTMGWKAGTFIEFAHYEMREGCADFTSPLASVKAY